MKTRYDVIREVIAQKVSEGIERDIREELGYGDRIKKAGMLVLADGVKATGYNDFEVASGTDSGKTYAVNGTCTCQDAQNWSKHERGEKVTTFAPRGLCKHKMAVELWKHARIHLKESQERFSLPHFDHRWNCDEHRTLAIECWHRICPDPIHIECPTCAAARAESDGEPLEENPTVPTDAEVTNEEACSEMDTTGEPTPPADETPTVTYTTTQYEEAPAVALPRPALPEAAASLNIKVRMDTTEVMYTMRSHTDNEVLERLPNVLATLEHILKIDVDHEEPFLKRLLHAFFPRPSKYTGK